MLVDWDLRHVWHPFTQMQSWPDDQPVIIQSAEGHYLIDDLGRRYFDGVSSLWVNVHGHRKKEIDDAIRAQLNQVAHSTLLGLASIPSIELAHRLVSLSPEGLNRVFYSDSGSTAVEVALKIAFQYWKQKGRPEKREFVALQEAYHGDTLGAVSAGGIDLFHNIFHPLLFPVRRIPSPGAPARATAEGFAHCLETAEQLFEKEHARLAALIIEPLVQGAAGIWVHPPGYLTALSELCRRYDVLLICDEVATGFGRTGSLFAVEQEDVRPDLLCIAKGLTGGYLPLAATLATDSVFSAFLGSVDEKKTFFHGHTYTGNPLACAAALANLALFESEQTLKRMKPTVEAFKDGWIKVRQMKQVSDVRQRGLMMGIELKDPAGKRLAFQVCQALRDEGILLRPLGNVVVVMPPLSTRIEEAQWIASSVGQAIEKVSRGEK